MAEPCPRALRSLCRECHIPSPLLGRLQEAVGRSLMPRCRGTRAGEAGEAVLRGLVGVCRRSTPRRQQARLWGSACCSPESILSVPGAVR